MWIQCFYPIPKKFNFPLNLSLINFDYVFCLFQFCFRSIPVGWHCYGSAWRIHSIQIWCCFGCNQRFTCWSRANCVHCNRFGNIFNCIFRLLWRHIRVRMYDFNGKYHKVYKSIYAHHYTVCCRCLRYNMESQSFAVKPRFIKLWCN